MYSLGTRRPRKKAPETGASASLKIWLLLELSVCVGRESPHSYPLQRAVGKCPLPRGLASCSPRHLGGWLSSRLSTVLSCPEEYRGQLTLPSDAQAP